jgi:hypothetical protein
MKVVNGVNYLSIGEVSEIVERGAQTIKNWYEFAEENSADLPKVFTDLDKRGTRYFKETDVPMLLDFRDHIKYGMMSSTSRKKWGKRGEVEKD